MSGGNSTKKGDSVEWIRDLIIDAGGEAATALREFRNLKV
jgi:hypothetical protein